MLLLEKRLCYTLQIGVRAPNWFSGEDRTTCFIDPEPGYVLVYVEPILIQTGPRSKELWPVEVYIGAAKFPSVLPARPVKTTGSWGFQNAVFGLEYRDQ